MSGNKRLLAVGGATLILGWVILFPARVAYRWFAAPDIQLSGISGTVWSGRAAEAAAGGLYVNDLKWRFRPLQLFTGKAAWSVEAEPVSGFIETGIAVTLGNSFRFSDLNAALTAASLNAMVPMSGVDGAVTLKFDSIVVHDGMPIEAIGTAAISNLVVPGLSRSTLGDYRAVFQTTDTGIRGQVEDLSGVLDLRGTIEFHDDQSYRFTGQVAAKPTAPDSVVQQLQFLGSTNAEGRHSFRFEGQL